MNDLKNSIFNIGIVDDELLFSNGLAMMINQHEKMQVNLQAENGVDLREKLETRFAESTDLILCDLEMPLMDGVKTVKFLNEFYPDIKIVILSSHYEPSLILKMLEIGASAFIPKTESPEEFYETVINVIKHGFHYNSHIVQLIREKMLFGVKKKRKSLVQLSKREKEVLVEICNQKTNKEIAETLFISVRTVEGHRTNLIQKTDSKNTAGIIVHAIEQGLFKVDLKNQMRWV